MFSQIRPHSNVGKAVAYATATLVPRAVGLAVLPVFTAYLSTEAYGQISLAETIAALVVTVTAVGLPASVLRLRAIDDGLQVSRIASMFLAMHVSLALGMVVSLLVVPQMLARWLPDAGVTFAMLAIATGTASVLQLFEAYQVIRQARGEAWRYAATAVGQSMLAVGAALLLLVVYQWGAVGVLSGRLLGALLAFGFLSVTMVRSVAARPDARLTKEVLVFAAPLVAHQLVALALTAADRFVIEAILDVSAVGLYALAYSFGSVLAILTTVNMLIWAPKFYAQVATEPQRMGDATLYWLTLAALVAIAAILVGPPVIPWVVDARYHEGISTVPFVMAGYFFHAGFSLFALQVMHARKTGRLALVTVWAAVANVGLNYLLIPYLGIEGAALATVLAYGLEVVLVWRIAQALAPLPHHTGRIVLAFALVFAVAACATWAPLGATLAAAVAAAVLLFVFTGREMWRHRASFLT